MTNNDDLVDVQKVHTNHQDISRNDDSTAIAFSHQLSSLEVVIRPVERVIHSNLLTSDGMRGIKLFPEIRKDVEAVLDARTENDDFLPLDVIDDPSKVRKFPVLNTMAEGAEEELNLWSAVRPLHCVITLKANKLADPFSLFTREQCRRHRNHDQGGLEACSHELDLKVSLSKAVSP